ncbi:MAG: cytidine deaminase [Clostridia bacterium]|nr:cytidine deaminase [Oscillospiraceae bacterium]MBO5357837.1 cytidine deaminase [Clostridia bacterium]
MTDKELMEIAVKAREMSYSPYSNFRVGAALLGLSGKVYTGCNVENAGYTPTNCAERTALFKAISEGEHEFTAIAIVGGLGDTLNDLCAPCGVCRQALSEFCDNSFRFILGNPKEIKVVTMGEILPYSFGKGDLKL